MIEANLRPAGSDTRPTLEDVACDLCGAHEPTTLVIKNGFRVVQCRGCSLVYVSPRPRARSLRELYETEHYQHHQVTRATDTSWRPAALARLALVHEHRKEKGKLLDVGCSTGWFLQVASEGGWDVTGIDVSAGSVAHVKSRGFDARLATLEDHDLEAGSFDVITMFDSIEHMPSPLAALRAAQALLVPGGVLVVTTPNVEGLFPRLTYQVFGRTLGAWVHPEPPGHVFQFGSTTLSSALGRTGFSILDERTEAIALDHTVGELEDSIMDVLAGRARRPSVASAAHDAAAHDQKTHEEKTPAAPAAAPATSQRTRLLRRAIRLGVRTGAWALTNAVARPAPWLGQGDSLVVVAKKRAA